MPRNIPRLLALAPTLAFAMAGMGCSYNSTVAKPLRSTVDTSTVEDCRHATVTPFGVPSGGKATVHTGEAFSGEIANRLRTDFGQLFDSVETAPRARGLERECLIGGQITKYKPGSRLARSVLIGLGAAHLEGTATVTDASGKVLLNAPFDKLWAWGGVLGVAKGIDDMESETAAAVANTVARAKGWTPPLPSDEPKR